MSTALLINDTADEPHHGCVLVMRHLYRLLAGAGVRVASRIRCGAYRQDYHSEQVKACDLIVVNGEGTTHHAGSRVQALFECVSRAREESQAPVFVVNAFIQELSESHYELLRSCEIVLCRESASLHDARSHGVSHAQLCPDLTLLRGPNEEARSPRPAGIVVTDSVLDDIAAALFTASRRLQARFMPVIAPDTNGWRRLLPGTFRALHQAGVPMRQDRLIRAFAINGLAPWLARMQGASLIVSGRFHGTCVAVKYGVPVLSIEACFHRLKGMLVDVGCPQLVIAEADLRDPSRLWRHLSMLQEQREAVSRRFRGYAAWADEEIRSTYTRLFAKASRPAVMVT